MDVEAGEELKGFGLSSYEASAYAVLLRLAGWVFLQQRPQYNSVVALLATLVIVLLARPVRDLIQSALDRAFYRDRYDYRRALVGFARDLSTDLDVARLADRLATRVTETLVVDRMAVMLRADDDEAYRTLRTNLLYSETRGSLRTIAITSAGEGEGKTTVSANVAGIACPALGLTRLKGTWIVANSPDATTSWSGTAWPIAVRPRCDTRPVSRRRRNASRTPPDPSTSRGVSEVGSSPRAAVIELCSCSKLTRGAPSRFRLAATDDRTADSMSLSCSGSNRTFVAT